MSEPCIINKKHFYTDYRTANQQSSTCSTSIIPSKLNHFPQPKKKQKSLQTLATFYGSNSGGVQRETP